MVRYAVANTPYFCTLFNSHSLLVIGYWLLVIGYWSVVSCQLQKNIFLPCPLPPAPCLLPIPVAEYWNKQTQ